MFMGMKKILLTFVIFISMAISGFAQYKPFQFGLNISPGINMTKANSENIIETKNNISFNWGFVGNFYFVENYGFSTGFNIINQKGNYNFIDTNDSIFNCKIKNQYIEIPLSLIMRTEKFGDFRIFSNIGYGLGICLNTKEEYHNSLDEEIQIPSEFKKIRHALILKLGVEYNVYKSSCLTLALKYNDNFANIYKSNNSFQQNIRLNSLCLEIGFIF